MIESAGPAVKAVSWDEDLRSQAAEGYRIASRLCTCSYPYHAIWGILRAANVTGSLRFEEDALGPVLKRLVKDNAQVLVAGSADTGTPSFVGRFSEARDIVITVADRCPAPLHQIEEARRTRNLPFRTLHSDLLEIDVEGAFDVVLINYTLNYIAPEARPEVFRRLARALKPGGTLICAAITRVGEVAADGKTREVWVENAFRKIKSAGLDLPLTDNELLVLLELGGESRVLRRQLRPTLQEIKDCMLGAGLVLDDENRTSREREMKADGMRAVELEPSVVLSGHRPR
jgi:SAM-dependent methyltransferase